MAKYEFVKTVKFTIITPYDEDTLKSIIDESYIDVELVHDDKNIEVVTEINEYEDIELKEIFPQSTEDKILLFLEDKKDSEISIREEAGSFDYYSPEGELLPKWQ